MADRSDGDPPEAPGTLRVDKWLWFTRAVKSRTTAAALVTAGKVRINRVRCEKSSQVVRQGDVVTVAVGPRVRVLEVAALGVRRGPASEAQGLYKDLTPPPAAAPEPAVRRDPGTGRPTKRDRRETDRLKDRNDQG